NSASATTRVRTVAVPVITIHEAALCPGSWGDASIMNQPDPSDPYDYWQNVQWTITNGTIQSQYGTSVSFPTNPAGGVLTLTATATDSYGCISSASVTTTVRTLAPPVIHVHRAAICSAAGSADDAFIDAPDPDNSWNNWNNVTWSITNGTITSQN